MRSLLVHIFYIPVILSQELSGDSVIDQLTNYSIKHPHPSFIETSFGTPVSDVTSILTAGPRGPILLQDVTFIDTISRFNRERIPDRVVHAKGSGAFGYFQVTNNITMYTKAKVFDGIGKKTRIAVRFSSASPLKEIPEPIRFDKGFAVKFYTEEGIWDIVGYSSPVFFLRDPMLFPLLVHAFGKNPKTGLRDFVAFWDFFSQRPESTNQLLYRFSDDIADGYHNMDGFGQHTFKFVNAEGRVHYVKFHFPDNQGSRSLTNEQSRNLTGTDPFYYTRELYNTIGRGENPSWTLYIQVMTPEESERFQWDPFDVTKIWPIEEYPLIEVGTFWLTENPKNYHADVEQIGFSPAHMVPGIEPSPDRMLHGRLFGYDDAQRYRIGTNFMQLPVNRPFHNREATNYQRDGDSTFYHQDGAPNYYPNSFNGPENNPRGAISSYSVCGDVGRFSTRDDDNFSQATILWNSFSREKKEDVVNNISVTLRQVPTFIQRRTINMFSNVSEEFGQLLERALQAEQTRDTNAS